MRDDSRSKKLSQVRRDSFALMKGNGGGIAGAITCCCCVGWTDGSTVIDVAVVVFVVVVAGLEVVDVNVVVVGDDGTNGVNCWTPFIEVDEFDIAIDARVGDVGGAISGDAAADAAAAAAIRSKTCTSCTPSNDSSNETTLSLPPRFEICVFVKLNEQLYISKKKKVCILCYCIEGLLLLLLL